MSDMTNEVAIRLLQTARDKAESAGLREAIDRGIKALEQEPCDMTAEQYRQRMMKAFHNADCSELIALCVLPTEKEFKHLEWLLKKEWRKEQEPKMGHWKAFIHSAYHGTDEDGEPIWREVTVYHCSQCNRRTVIKENFCPNCGSKNVVEPQESEE